MARAALYSSRPGVQTARCTSRYVFAIDRSDAFERDYLDSNAFERSSAIVNLTHQSIGGISIDVSTFIILDNNRKHKRNGRDDKSQTSRVRPRVLPAAKECVMFS